MYTCIYLTLYACITLYCLFLPVRRTRGESRTLERLRVHKVRRLVVALSRGRSCVPSAGGGCRGIAAENEDGMKRGMEENAVAPGATAAATAAATLAESAKGVVRERTRVFFHHQLLAASANPSRSPDVREGARGRKRDARTNSQIVKVPNSYLLLRTSSSPSLYP